MIYTVHITEQAFDDMNNIYRYIFDTLQAPNAAKNQYNRIANAINRLNIFPERIKPIDADFNKSLKIRQMFVDNYSVFFKIENNRVVVLRVLYSASDIRKRLEEGFMTEQ